MHAPHTLLLLVPLTASVHAISETSALPLQVDDEVERIVDAEVEPYRVELLEMAYSAVSALPLDPHVKTRSREQELVARACFELDLPNRALRYVDGIENWRRGTGFAEFAVYGAQHGLDLEAVVPELARAIKVSEWGEDRLGQTWRRDRIRAAIARAYVALGRLDLARRYEEGAEDAEAGKANAVRAQVLSENQFEPQMESLKLIAERGSFDRRRTALRTLASLYERFYSDADKRALIRETVTATWDKLPVMVRVETMLELGEAALLHGDLEGTVEIVAESRQMMEAIQWQPEHQIPLLARLASLRGRAGDLKGAMGDLATAKALFHTVLQRIVNIYRAETLRPIAEAYLDLGEVEHAVKLYHLALQAGVENPNGRPRAEDLSATLCSLAVKGLEPDEALWARLRRVHGMLGDPW